MTSAPRTGRHRGLYYSVSGDSETSLVLLHGSLNDHTSWNRVVPLLSPHVTVFSYDRRGHSRSEDERRRDSIHEYATDLGIVIEEIVGKPAHVAGTSGGAAIALRLGARRPDLFLSLTAHEPPLIGALSHDARWREYQNGLKEKFAQFRKLMESGQTTEAAAYFVDALSDGPGTWHSMPESKRDLFAKNVWTLYYESVDDEFLEPEFDALAAFDKPTLLTQGAQSAPFFAPILDLLLERALPAARRHTFPTAAHVPHESHPDDYAATVLAFIRAS